MRFRELVLMAAAVGVLLAFADQGLSLLEDKAPFTSTEPKIART